MTPAARPYAECAARWALAVVLAIPACNALVDPDSLGSGAASSSGAGGAASSSSAANSASSTAASGGGGGAGSAYASEVLADDPLGYWRFGETPPSVAVDSSGYDRDGTYKGGVTLAVPGAIVGDSDTAAQFDGVDDGMEVGDFFDFTGLEAFSLEVWVRPDAPDGLFRSIVGKEEANGPNGFGGYNLVMKDIELGFNRSLDGIFQGVNVPAPPSSERSHVVATFDGTDLILFVNGVL